MSDENLKTAITAVLSDHCFRDKDGLFYSKIYADYRDEFCDKSIMKICRSDAPRDRFYEIIDELYSDADSLVIADLIQHMVDLDEIGEMISRDETSEDEIRDLLYDLHYVKLPYDHYLNQEFYIDLIVDSGDMNYDYSLNTPYYYGRFDKPVDDAAGILWLTRQQGYRKTDLNNALRKEEFVSPLLKSIYEEVINCSSSMNALTFLISVDFRKWFELHDAVSREKHLNQSYHPGTRRGRGYIIIAKDVVCGLYDAWYGAGGLLEITLEKDVKLPIRLIDSYHPDGYRGYGVRAIWGLCWSQWRDSIREIHPQKNLKSTIPA